MLDEIKTLREDCKEWAKEKLRVWRDGSPTKHFNKVIANGIINYKETHSAYISVLGWKNYCLLVF